MATTDPEPPKRSVHVHQERIEGGVGVSIGHADTVIHDSGKLRAYTTAGLGLFFVVLVVSFLTNIAGVQDGLCRVPGLHAACAALNLGHLPSPEERLAWAAAQSGDDCEALRAVLTRWPTGAFAAEASARLQGRSVTTETSWVQQEMRLPMTVRGGALFDDEPAAREDALQRASTSAAQTCEPLKMSPMHRLLGSAAAVEAWSCVMLDHRWRCGFDGSASCRLEVGRSTPQERCAPSKELP